MRAAHRSFRLLVAGAVAAAAGATAALSPADAAPAGPRPVTGNLVQAYQASYYRPGPAELEAANRPIRDTAPLVLSATPVGRKGAEPTLGVTKEGNAFMVAADFDGLSPATPQTRILASYNGNRSWQDVTPQVAGRTFPPTTLDPYLYVDKQTGRIFSDDLTLGCSVLQWSDDQGKTWSRGNPLACEAPVDDHQTLVTGNPPPGLTTSGYPRVLYYCVNKIADAQCARSLDGGSTFLPSGQPAFAEPVRAQSPDGSAGGSGVCGSLHGHIVTDPAGRLYLPKGHCGNPWLAVSEDGGQTWRRTQVSRVSAAGIQTSVASDTAGNLYYLWWSAKNFLPYLAVSRDHGKSFGPAVMVAPPGVKAVNFPSIDASSPGHVAISFPGSRSEDKTSYRPWDYYLAVSTDALQPLPIFHSATANALSDPVHRGPCNGRCGNMFDFLDVVLAPSGEAWGTAVDTCTGPCVSAPGPTLTSAQRPSDARAIVVRQLSGPGLPRR